MKIKVNICIILLSATLFSTMSLAREKPFALEKNTAIKEATLPQKIMVQIELASFNKKQQNPYFALWLSKANNEHKALVVVREKIKWLRDLKKFWRSIARENRRESDAVTGATIRAKTFSYEFSVNHTWDTISLEVAREHGTRELITLPLSYTKTCVDGKHEIATLCTKLVNSN